MGDRKFQFSLKIFGVLKINQSLMGLEQFYAELGVMHYKQC